MIFPTTPKKEIKHYSLSFSEFLPIGYLYLLILGIIAESIYYGLIGINFLSYASILDVLLGPVAILTDKPLLLIILVVTGTLFYYLMIIKHRKSNKPQAPDVTVDGTTAFITVMAVMVLAAFIGYGVGRGFKERSRIAENDIEHNSTLHFLNGEKKEVRKLGNTSTFIFHIQKDQKSISISPISNNIKEIEQMK